MKDYIIIDNFKIELIEGLKTSGGESPWKSRRSPSGVLGKNTWSYYNRDPHYKLKVKISTTDFDKLKSIFAIGKENYLKLIDFIMRSENTDVRHRNDAEIVYKSGSFFPIGLRGLSKTKSYQIIQMEVSELKIGPAPVDVSRDLRVDELFG